MMTTYFDSSFIILLVLAAICYLSHNNTVTFAILILLLFKVSPLNIHLPWLQKNGMTIGIVILTAAMLVPIATGKMTLPVMLKVFTQWQSILAIIIGIFVSWAGMRGVGLLSGQPLIVTGLIVGTIIGVTFFKGVPVGPLIAAGILSLFIGK